MPGRITYFKVLRKIHHYSSIIILMFALMYIFTGYVLIRHDIFPHGEATETFQSYYFSQPVDTTNYFDFLKGIKEAYNLSGRTEKIVKSGTYNFKTWIAKPGLWHELTFDTRKDSLYIKTREQMSFGRVVSRLHLTRHFHGGIKYVIWSVFYDLAAISFILFSVTGILIWYKLRKSMKYGGIILAATTLFVLLVMAYLMM